MNQAKVQRKLLCFVLVCLLTLNVVYPIYAENIEENQLSEEAIPPDPELLKQSEMQELDLKGRAYYDEARKVLEMVNELRASLGVEPLELNLQLEDLALVRAAETSVHWDHRRPDGTYLYETNASVAGENIAGGLSNARSVFDNWLKSPGHYANMVDPAYKSIGIAAYGTVQGKVPHWWSQVFSTNLSGTPMPERSNGITVEQRIKVAPEFLKMEIRSAAEMDRPLNIAGLDERPALRLQLGEKLRVYGLTHYIFPDDFPQAGSLPEYALSWENSDSSVITLDEEGNLEAVNYGSAVVSASHKDFPELKAELRVEVLPVNIFRLKARLAEEASQALAEQCQALYAQKPHVSEYSGESSGTANKEKEMLYRYYDALSPDSRLYEIAWPLLKQFSTFLYPDSMHSLPQIKQIVEELDQGARISWHCFSDLDSLEDQNPNVPGWAQSFAALVLDSAGHKISIIIYSDLPGDGVVPAQDQLLINERFSNSSMPGPETTEAVDPNAAETAGEEAAVAEQEPPYVIYDVPVFADLDNYVLNFSENQQIAMQIDFANAYDPRISFNDFGQIKYQPELLLSRAEQGPYPPISPASDVIFFGVDNAEIAGFTEDGKLLIKQAGSFILTANVVDAATQETIASGSIQVNNYLAINYTGGEEQVTISAPEVAVLPSEEVENTAPLP